MSRDCPNCGEPLSIGGKCTNCAYGRDGRRTSSGSQIPEDQRNRCTYASNHTQCRYIGSATQQTSITAPLFCSGHMDRHDPIDGQRVVEESMREVPDNFDYSTENVVRRTREQFRNNVPLHPALNRKQAGEIAERMPHVAARLGLHKRRLFEDREADLEREALQSDT